jgi:hypothetical protein
MRIELLSEFSEKKKEETLTEIREKGMVVQSSPSV